MMRSTLLNLAHTIRKFWWKVRKPQTLGVKVLVRNSRGEILLVKPAYASSWQIPGGGVEKFEHPRRAGIREIREETGLQLYEDHMVLKDVFISHHEGKSDCVIFYEATCGEVEATPDGIEIESAQFFAPSALPIDVSPSVRRRTREISEGGYW